MKRGFLKYLNFFNLKGRFISLDSSVAVKRFFYSFSSNCFSKSADFRNSFLPTISFYDIDGSDNKAATKNFYSFFLFGVNTRFESPVFNLKIKEILYGFELQDVLCPAFSFGFSFNSSFYLSHLSNNFCFLINKISGLDCNKNLLFYDKKIFFFILGSKTSIFDSYVKYLLQTFVEMLGNSDVNYMHISGSSNLHSLNEINYFDYSNNLDLVTRRVAYFPFIFMNFGESCFSSLKSSVLNLSCYLGHHGGNFLKSFNLILPVKFFYEKSLSYINTEGYFQKAGFLKIDYKYHYIRSEKRILDIFGKMFNINSYMLNLEKFYKLNNIIPGYGEFLKNNFFTKLFISRFSIKSIFLKNFFFMNISSSINDYFLSDHVSNNSITMSLCSKKFTIFNDFIYIYGSN